MSKAVINGAAVWVSAVLVLAAACSASDYSRRADRSATRLLDEREGRTLGNREATAQRPVELPAPAEDEGAPPQEEQAGAELPGESGAKSAVPEGPAPTLIDLRQALAIAFRSNRQMLSEKEALHLQAISLSGVRHTFAPQLALTLSYLFDEQPGATDVNSGLANFSASQILSTGATLSLTGASGASATEGSSGIYDSLIGVTLAQPLLRGGGYDVTHEAVVQAERNLVYAIREFELFREDFTIDVASRFYDLVNRKQSIANQHRNLENNEFGRRQAEALFAVGRANELDVLRARRSELTARNDLLEAQEGMHLALDNFRIFLGLPESQPIDVGAEAPPFTPVRYDVVSALEVALANRLDLLNRQEQLEDSERNVRLSRNALLPSLDLTLATFYSNDDQTIVGGSDFERDGTSVALALEVPLDRVNERNAYRSAEINLGRARRDLEEFEDQLRVSIQSSFRELERRLASLEIQRQLIVDQTKNLRIAELRFERGELPNRDVVEANESLLDAQNALIDEQVNYEIARLRLLRDLGILFIDETGMWKT